MTTVQDGSALRVPEPARLCGTARKGRVLVLFLRLLFMRKSISDAWCGTPHGIRCGVCLNLGYDNSGSAPVGARYRGKDCVGAAEIRSRDRSRNRAMYSPDIASPES